MTAIWKYPFAVADELFIPMPAGAEILYVDVQKELPCIWARVDPNRPSETRRFMLYGTGHRIEDAPTKRHIGSFQMYNGDLVFHLFEVAQ